MKHWTRKLLGIVLCAAMVMGLMPGVMPAAKAALSGSGTETDPYLISTADELLEFRDIVNGEHASIAKNISACAKLIGDIDMNGIAWTSIASSLCRLSLIAPLYIADHVS